MFEQSVARVPFVVTWRDGLHGPAPKPDKLHFTPRWPGTHDWASGKYFKIKKTAVTHFAKSYTIPGANDYKEIDLSNSTAGIKLYPDSKGNVHEILLGFKPGNYIWQVDVPNNKSLTKLPESSMIPSKTDADLIYLNAWNPEDSPHTNPTQKFWAVKDMPAIVIRLIALAGNDFERCTMDIRVAEHELEELASKPDVATPIFWHEEFTW